MNDLPMENRRYLSSLILVLIFSIGGFLAMIPSAKALSFDHEIGSNLSPQRIWELLTQALSGDHSSGLWPTSYSTISGDVVNGGNVTEVVFGWSKIQYRLSDVTLEKRLTYSPQAGQALVGRSHIELYGRPDGGTTIHWFGNYEVSPLSPRGVVLRFYEQVFFYSFERNLRRITSRET
jgi:hypothetical protein